MKEVTYNDGGSVTPEMQAEFLSRYAHLEGITDDGITKYYSYPETGKGFKVTFFNGKAVQVTRMSIDEVKTMVACSKLKFGE